MLLRVEVSRIPLKRQQLMRLAKKACTQKVIEGGQWCKCGDIYRMVTVSSTGKILSIKCYMHNHSVHGKQRELVHPI